MSYVGAASAKPVPDRGTQSLYVCAMNSREHARAKALTQRDVMDLVRAGVILALTIAAAIVVPPQVFGA